MTVYHKVCGHSDCSNRFTCHGECKDKPIVESNHVCFCPKCAGRIKRLYSARLIRVCPRFNELKKEQVIFT